MNKPDKPGEPTMEEILASIRQIIADDPPIDGPQPNIEANPLVPQARDDDAGDRLSEVLRSGPLPPTSPLGSKRPLSFDKDLADMFDEQEAGGESTSLAPKPDLRMPAGLSHPMTPKPFVPSPKADSTRPLADGAAAALPPQLAADEPFSPPPFFGASEPEAAAAPAETPLRGLGAFPPLRKSGFYPPQPGANEASPRRDAQTGGASLPRLQPEAADAEDKGATRLPASALPRAAGPGASGAGTSPYGKAAPAPAMTSPADREHSVPGSSLRPDDRDAAPMANPAPAPAPFSPPRPKPAFTSVSDSVPSPKLAAPAPEIKAPVTPATSEASSPSSTASDPTSMAGHQALDALAQGLAASAAASVAGAAAIPLTPVAEPKQSTPAPEPSTLPAATTAPQPAAPAPAPAMATASPPAARTLEDVVADMLKPILQQWVDENMPRIVERALRNEVGKTLSAGRTPPES
ncbi:DUF2497 domain-containing protein [Hyphomicrobium sp.]|uniref:DUF2497 domain-containing protein n=1 Tax=Hyphomicrobium sp. TaxID=82 RepID=UPI002FDC7B3D